MQCKSMRRMRKWEDPQSLVLPLNWEGDVRWNQLKVGTDGIKRSRASCEFRAWVFNAPAFWIVCCLQLCAALVRCSLLAHRDVTSSVRTLYCLRQLSVVLQTWIIGLEKQFTTLATGENTGSKSLKASQGEGRTTLVFRETTQSDRHVCTVFVNEWKNVLASVTFACDGAHAQ